jgi:succinoglycan biosynthesis protein ExoA
VGLRVRQVIPPAVLVTLILSAALSFVRPWLLLYPAAYFGTCGLAGVWLALRARKLCFVLGGAALPAMHLPWAAGFWLSFMAPRTQPQA